MADGVVLPMSDVVQRWPAEDDSMAQHFDHHRRATAEERQFLEALCFLRGLYAERGPRDRASVARIASIASIVAETEQRMRAFRLEASA
jgi:hypothetical protein